jgi:aldehyde dehydrogenase (NAD+)
VNVSLQGLSFKYDACWIDKFAGEPYPQEDGFLKIVRNEPLGVTVGIVPWNGHLGSVGLKAGLPSQRTMLSSSNPSEKTPFAALTHDTLIKRNWLSIGHVPSAERLRQYRCFACKPHACAQSQLHSSAATGKKIQEMAARLTSNR